ncbi:MAG: RnfABCDGE type electron transport complex subunit C [Planctomycetes bacterium]|nr:RnfABCDGE type electron transport complex subunit C [Planctomycetota bacterium]
MFRFIRRGTFYGGIFLPSAKSSTENCSIEPLPLAKRLFVPVAEGTVPAVHDGDRVRAGQRLARSESGYEDTFCPVDGRVRTLTVVATVWDNEVLAVEIDVQQERLTPPATAAASPPDWAALDEEAVTRAVLLGAGSAAEQIDQARQRGVSHVIVNGMESEPCRTADHRILVEYGALLVGAAHRLHEYLDAKRTYIALDAAQEDLVRTIRKLAKRTPIRVVDLQNRYPVGTDPLLVQTLIGREIPLGGEALDIGALVLGVDTIFHFGRALSERVPATARVVTVAGSAIDRPGNYWVPNGTPVRHVLQSVGLQSQPRHLIVGGPMTGRPLLHDDVILTLRCPALLALPPQDGTQEASTACVRCGWCAEVCPMKLEPALLLQAIELQQERQLARLHPGACIDCGLCSYVCPSSLPLASSISDVRNSLEKVAHRGRKNGS